LQAASGRADGKTTRRSSTTISTLSQEIDSLKVVLDLRNSEISELKQSKAELKKQVIIVQQLHTGLFFTIVFSIE